MYGSFNFHGRGCSTRSSVFEADSYLDPILEIFLDPQHITSSVLPTNVYGLVCWSMTSDLVLIETPPTQARDILRADSGARLPSGLSQAWGSTPNSPLSNRQKNGGPR